MRRRTYSAHSRSVTSLREGSRRPISSVKASFGFPHGSCHREFSDWTWRIGARELRAVLGLTGAYNCVAVPAQLVPSRAAPGAERIPELHRPGTRVRLGCRCAPVPNIAPAALQSRLNSGAPRQGRNDIVRLSLGQLGIGPQLGYVLGSATPFEA